MTANEELIEAAINGDRTGVERALNATADINYLNSKGKTALCLAIQKDHPEVAYFLLERGASLMVMPSHNFTALHIAAMNGELEITKEVIKYQSNLDARDAEEMTPMHWAAMHGFKEVVRYLITKGASIHATRNDHRTGVHLAAIFGKFAAIKPLIAEGADLEAQDNEGKTALHHSAEQGHAETVAYLIRVGARTDAKDKLNRTPLDLLALNHHNLKSILQQPTSSHTNKSIIDWVKKGYLSSLKSSLSVINVNTKNESDDNETSLLQYAVKRNHTKIVEYLINEGTNIEYRRKDGKNAFDLAMLKGHVAIGKLLSTKAKQLGIFTQMLEGKDHAGISPLRHAVNKNQTASIQYLLSQNVEIIVADYLSAKENGTQHICDLLAQTIFDRARAHQNYTVAQEFFEEVVKAVSDDTLVNKLLIWSRIRLFFSYLLLPITLGSAVAGAVTFYSKLRDHTTLATSSVIGALSIFYAYVRWQEDYDLLADITPKWLKNALLCLGAQAVEIPLSNSKIEDFSFLDVLPTEASEDGLAISNRECILSSYTELHESVAKNERPQLLQEQPLLARSTKLTTASLSKGSIEQEDLLFSNTFNLSCYGASFEPNVPVYVCRDNHYQLFLSFKVAYFEPSMNPHYFAASTATPQWEVLQTSSCRPVEFYGREAVHCQGEQLTSTYVPRLPAKPLEGLGANIMLAAVTFNITHKIGSKLLGWLRGNPAVRNKDQLSVPQGLANITEGEFRIEQCRKTLYRLEEKLHQLSQTISPKELRWAKWALEDNKEELTKALVEGELVTETQLQDIEAEIAELVHELQEDYPSDNNTISTVHQGAHYTADSVGTSRASFFASHSVITQQDSPARNSYIPKFLQNAMF